MAMFQKEMDEILEGIPHMICYIHDILIMGADEAEHLEILCRVLDLEKHDLRFKLSKQISGQVCQLPRTQAGCSRLARNVGEVGRSEEGSSAEECPRTPLLPWTRS